MRQSTIEQALCNVHGNKAECHRIGIVHAMCMVMMTLVNKSCKKILKLDKSGKNMAERGKSSHIFPFMAS